MRCTGFFQQNEEEGEPGASDNGYDANSFDDVHRAVVTPLTLAKERTMRAAIPLGFTIEVADSWCDVTDDLPTGSPFTLAREDGVGAFQFSSALFSDGVAPNAAAQTLREMLLSFGREKALGEPASVRVCHDNVVSVGGSFKKEDSIRVWFISNGRDFVMATHTSSEDAPNEVAQCETMVRSIEFK